MSTLGQRLKTIRENMSQKDVAMKLGIPQQTWANYETDKSNPNFLLVEAICTLFKVNTDWLLFGRGPMRPEETITTASLAGGNIDKDVLTDVVMALEDMLQEKSKKLPPRAKAEVIYELYMLMIEEEAEARKPSIMRLVKGALAG